MLPLTNHMRENVKDTACCLAGTYMLNTRRSLNVENFYAEQQKGTQVRTSFWVSAVTAVK